MKKLMAILISVTLLCGVMLPALAESSEKDETVYILAQPDGTARKIIVSDWLSNPEAQTVLKDATTLNDVENVKGSETFDGSAWQADGNDIYYQGTSEESLPIALSVSYTLDGAAVSPQELAGKDGKVTIRFDYQVAEQRSVLLNGQQETMTVPFAVLTGALLDNQVFTNVEVVNGRVMNDGDHTVVVGVALPGMQENLALDAKKLEVPAYVEISADAKGFALPVTVTLATNEPFAMLDVDELNDTADLKKAMNDLSDGMTRLLDGSVQLSDGLDNLGTGANTLAEGIGSLSDGLTTLTGNNETLVAGSTQVFNTLLATANQQLASSSANVPELTIDNYSDVLSALIASMTEEGITEQARAKVEQSVRAQEDKVRAAVTQAVQSEVESKVEAAVRENVLSQVLAAANLTPDSYNAAQKAGQLSEAQQKQIETAVEQQMASEQVKATIRQQTEAQMATEEGKAAIAQNTETQIQGLIDQNMASENVQKQIQASLKQYQATCEALTALKEQLDSYHAFHAGLIAYTDGVASAAEGAAQLNEGVPALQEGIAQLQTGVLDMKDGLTTFNADGVEKLTALVNDNLDGLLNRVRALAEAAQSYSNYAGIADGMNGTVRFVWRTDAIEP